jgi:hypothetical protein
MPAITCRKCGAVVRVQSRGDDIEVSYGSSFRESCKSLSGSDSPNLIPRAAACPHMQEAIERAHFRITHRKKRQARDELVLNSAPSERQTEQRDNEVCLRR